VKRKNDGKEQSSETNKGAKDPYEHGWVDTEELADNC